MIGMCLCFVFYKCKTTGMRKKATMIKSTNHSLQQRSLNIEMEERVYNIIDDEDMLDDKEIHKMQIEMSSDIFNLKK